MSKRLRKERKNLWRVVPLDLIASARHHALMIYKIFRAAEWEQLQSDGTTDGAPIDVTDGYIHFSTSEQVAETAAKHFAGDADLYLVSVDEKTLGEELKWEPSRGGALFPHLYRKMSTADVVAAYRLPLVDGVHQFPEGVL